MGIFVMQAWQGGALPLSCTRAKWVQIIARTLASATFLAGAWRGEAVTEKPAFATNASTSVILGVNREIPFRKNRITSTSFGMTMILSSLKEFRRFAERGN